MNLRGSSQGGHKTGQGTTGMVSPVGDIFSCRCDILAQHGEWVLTWSIHYGITDMPTEVTSTPLTGPEYCETTRILDTHPCSFLIPHPFKDLVGGRVGIGGRSCEADTIEGSDQLRHTPSMLYLAIFFPGGHGHDCEK